MMMKPFFKKHVALTQEHGSWVFLFSPLLIGLFAGGKWWGGSGFLVLTALAAFLFRQPLTVAVKVFSGRRSQADLPAAYFWMGVYGVAALGGLVGLFALGQGYLVVLAIPALPVLGWYLYLVTRRAERRQIGVEIVASGVLALAAPAGFWIGIGEPDSAGWWLWVLTWFQSAASIVYAALRLEQRPWPGNTMRKEKLRAAGRALAYTTFNLAGSVGLSVAGILPPWVWLAFLVQWVETLWGTLVPAVGAKPTQVGFRQLAVSTIFTLVFILTWG